MIQSVQWAYVVDDRASPALAWYGFTPDCSGSHQQTELKHFTGLPQADCYASYDKLNDIEPQAYIADVIEKITSEWPRLAVG